MKIKNPFNKILFERRHSIYIPKGNKNRSDTLVEELNANLSQLGFSLSNKLIKRFKSLSKKDFEYHSKSLIRLLQEYTGSNKTYRPLFVNFPLSRTIQASFFAKLSTLTGKSPETYENYTVLSCGHIIDNKVVNLDNYGACPVCEQQIPELLKKDFESYKEVTPLKIIDFIQEDEIYNILNNLLSSTIPLSEKDFNDISTIVKNNKMLDIKKAIPSDIPVRENFAYFYKTLFVNDFHSLIEKLFIEKKFTATDILRIAAAFSEGDISLKSPTRYISFSNKTRRTFLSILDQLSNPIEDMSRYSEYWKRLGEKLHPCSMKNRYPNACEYFSKIRNGKVKTYYSELGESLKYKDFQKAIKLLSQRPGEFIRYLDFFIRNNVDIVPYFSNVVDQVKTKDLLVVEKFLSSRTEDFELRYFFPKGDISKIYIEENNLKPLDENLVKRVISIIEKSLLNRFKGSFPSKVYIDPVLKEITIPKSLKGYSSGMKIYPRGSRIPYNRKKTTRMFLYWKAPVDLDLSVTILDKDFNVIETCAYTDLESKSMLHSGDIRSAPNGGAEFVDITNPEGKYIIPSVISYSGETFNTIEAFVGVMERDKPKSGAKFEPSTVEKRFDLSGEAKNMIPFIFDIEENKIVSADIYGTGDIGQNIYSLEEKFINILKVVLDLNRTVPSMYRLFELYAKANNSEIVSTPEEASFVISENGDLKPTELDIISSDYIK